MSGWSTHGTSGRDCGRHWGKWRQTLILPEDKIPESPDRATICPLCGTIPEAACFTRESSPYVWSGMLERHICAFCSLELAIEFYLEDSRYFTAAARMLGIGAWECRKRYLEEIIAGTERGLTEKQCGSERVELERRMRDCRFQLAAIERYISAGSGSAGELELRRARKELRRALAEPAFGAEVALPNLVTIVFD